ncbi:ABC transporter ATP-binding protein [Halobacteriovorax sp.]|uniref:ABC transporter ATP-binding protein n=1 Tax=Halobacteriovorax sp. TaxID=2020862 RepID=UPI003568C045
MKTLLEVKNLRKSFDHKSIAAIENLSFELLQNEIVSIIGPSGTGKSTLVKMIAGEIAADEGSILFDKNISIDNFKNNFSYVPQELSLDNSKTIFENIGTHLIEENEEKRHHAIRDMIEVFGLQYKDHKYPSELSTGQKSRVEMAKALVTNPRLLILDEPFANLDRSLRNEIKSELVEILKERKISALIVTHNLEDAFSHSDKIMVLNDGGIKQFSPAREVYTRPADAWVAHFTGPVNLMAGTVGEAKTDEFQQTNKLDTFTVPCYDKKINSGDFAYMLIRPEACVVSKEGKYKGKVKKIIHLGPTSEVWLQIGGIERFKVSASLSDTVVINRSVKFDINIDQCQLLSI